MTILAPFSPAFLDSPRGLGENMPKNIVGALVNCIHPKKGDATGRGGGDGGGRCNCSTCNNCKFTCCKIAGCKVSCCKFSGRKFTCCKISSGKFKCCKISGCPFSCCSAAGQNPERSPSQVNRKLEDGLKTKKADKQGSMAFWTMQKMVENANREGGGKILALGARVMEVLLATEQWRQELSPVPWDIYKVVLGYSGPNWEVIYLYLIQFVELNYKEGRAELYLAVIKNIDEMTKDDEDTDDEEEEPKVVQKKKKKKIQIPDMRIWEELVKSVECVYSIWGTESGVRCLDWALFHYQTFVSALTNTILRLSKALERHWRSSQISSMDLIEHWLHFESSSLVIGNFATTVMSFLPVVLKKYRMAIKPNLKEIMHHSCASYTEFLIGLLESPEFCIEFEARSFPSAIKDALDILETIKDDPDANDLTLWILTCLLCALSRIYENQFTTITLISLEKHLSKSAQSLSSRMKNKMGVKTPFQNDLYTILITRVRDTLTSALPDLVIHVDTCRSEFFPYNLLVPPGIRKSVTDIAQNLKTVAKSTTEANIPVPGPNTPHGDEYRKEYRWNVESRLRSKCEAGQGKDDDEEEEESLDMNDQLNPMIFNWHFTSHGVKSKSLYSTLEKIAQILKWDPVGLRTSLRDIPDISQDDPLFRIPLADLVFWVMDKVIEGDAEPAVARLGAIIVRKLHKRRTFTQETRKWPWKTYKEVLLYSGKEWGTLYSYLDDFTRNQYRGGMAQVLEATLRNIYEIVTKEDGLAKTMPNARVWNIFNHDDTTKGKELQAIYSVWESHEALTVLNFSLTHFQAHISETTPQIIQLCLLLSKCEDRNLTEKLWKFQEFRNSVRFFLPSVLQGINRGDPKSFEIVYKSACSYLDWLTRLAEFDIFYKYLESMHLIVRLRHAIDILGNRLPWRFNPKGKELITKITIVIFCILSNTTNDKLTKTTLHVLKDTRVLNIENVKKFDPRSLIPSSSFCTIDISEKMGKFVEKVRALEELLKSGEALDYDGKIAMETAVSMAESVAKSWETMRRSIDSWAKEEEAVGDSLSKKSANVNEISGICGYRKRRMYARMKMALDTLEFYRGTIDHIPDTPLFATSDNLYKMDLNSFALVTMEMMMHNEKLDIICTLGCQILTILNAPNFKLRAAMVNLRSLEKVSDWAANFNGPCWLPIYLHLTQMHMSQDTKEKARDHLFQSLSKNLKSDAATSNSTSIVAIKSGEKWTLAAFWTLFCAELSRRNSAQFAKWDTEPGISILTWNFSYFQKYPLDPGWQKFVATCRLLMLSRGPTKSSLLFSKRLWTSATFGREFMFFLPNALQTLKMGEAVKGNLRRKGMLLIVATSFLDLQFQLGKWDGEYRAWFQRSGVLKMTRDALKFLSESPEWRSENNSSQNVTFSIFVMIFCTLVHINNPVYTKTALIFLSREIRACDCRKMGKFEFGGSVQADFIRYVQNYELYSQRTAKILQRFVERVRDLDYLISISRQASVASTKSGGWKSTGKSQSQSQGSGKGPGGGQGAGTRSSVSNTKSVGSGAKSKGSLPNKPGVGSGTGSNPGSGPVKSVGSRPSSGPGSGSIVVSDPKEQAEISKRAIDLANFAIGKLSRSKSIVTASNSLMSIQPPKNAQP